jgi:hypothetical protein
MPHVCIGQGQCDRRQAKWTTKLLTDKSQRWACLGTHSNGQTCNFEACGIWPCLSNSSMRHVVVAVLGCSYTLILFIQQQYATYRSVCVRLLLHRTLLALRLQYYNTIRYIRHYKIIWVSKTAAINSRPHALLQYEHAINCNSDYIWANVTVSLQYIFKSSAEYSAINYLTLFIYAFPEVSSH